VRTLAWQSASRPSPGRGRWLEEPDEVARIPLSPCKTHVIANQSADWCGNPLQVSENYKKAPGPPDEGSVLSYGSRNYRGIATPVTSVTGSQ